MGKNHHFHDILAVRKMFEIWQKRVLYESDANICNFKHFFLFSWCFERSKGPLRFLHLDAIVLFSAFSLFFLLIISFFNEFYPFKSSFDRTDCRRLKKSFFFSTILNDNQKLQSCTFFTTSAITPATTSILKV